MNKSDFVTTNTASAEVFGVSEALLAEFAMLKDIQDIHGKQKFSQAAVEKLAMHLVCRHYGNLCYELSHLNWCIVHGKGLASNSVNDLLSFYWVDSGHQPRACTAFFEKIFASVDNANMHFQSKQLEVFEKASFSVNGKHIHIAIYEHQFTVNVKRVNLLACLMEWLVHCIPNLLSLIDTSLKGKGLNGIKELSSELQKQIYQYLSNHLPPAKLQQRYRKLSTWYQNKTLSDDNLLKFWLAHHDIEGFVKYSGTVYDTFAYAEASELAKTQKSLLYAKASNELVSTETNADNIFDELNPYFDYYAEHSFSFAREYFEEPVKALAKKQLDLVSLCIEYPNIAPRFSLSVFRSAVFGKYQHQVIQALRSNKMQEQWPSLQSDYRAFKEQIVQVIALNQQSLLAIAYIQLRHASVHCADLINQLSKELFKFSELPQCLIELLAPEMRKANTQEGTLDLATLKNMQSQASVIEIFCDEIQHAFKLINRQGFTPKSIASDEDYVRLSEKLLDLNKVIKQTLANFSKQKLDVEANFEADRSILLDEFKKIHSQSNYEY